MVRWKKLSVFALWLCVAIAATPVTVSAQQPSPTGSVLTLTGLWYLIGAAGIFGGLLFGIKDRRLVLPHRTSKSVIDPGFLVDFFFGLAGGYVIFMLVPGDFNIGDPWNIIKIVAVAIVGGYGGRALVEKVLSQQIQELENHIQEMKEQGKQDATAISLLHEYLDSDPDNPVVPVKELKDAITGASSGVRVQAFILAREFRKKYFRTNPELLVKTIPVFEALIDADVDKKYHRNHAQLGYVLKDIPQPDYKRAESELTTAIDIRDRMKISGFKVYEFNRAICRIHRNAPLEDIKRDLDRALRGKTTADWVRHPDEQLAAPLIHWLKENADTLADWIKANHIEIPA